MKKFLIWSLAVALMTVSLDIVFGYMSKRYFATHHLPGDYRNTEHIMRVSTDSIVVLGSSVALNSIDTRKLSDSLGMSAYNGGANAQSMPYHLVLLEAMMKRHCPKAVLLGVLPSNLNDEGAGTRFNFLAPYYGIGYDRIDSTMQAKGTVERVMLNSSMYRLNGIWLRILLYHFVTAGIEGQNGFIAKDVPQFFPSRAPQPDRPMTAERRSELREFARLCRQGGTNLIVFLPPDYYYDSDNLRVVAQLDSLASAEGFEVWHDSSLPPFAGDSTLFYDNTHINFRGAEIYTDSVIARLRQRL